MKPRKSINLAVAVVVALSLALASPVLAQQRRASGQVGAGGGACSGGFGTLFDQIEVTSVSAAETNELVYLREEEKLARDVYLTIAVDGCGGLGGRGQRGGGQGGTGTCDGTGAGNSTGNPNQGGGGQQGGPRDGSCAG
ncbi:MAG: hypothetical protein ACC742_06935 [Thermoanaerobaculales bacterium]